MYSVMVAGRAFHSENWKLTPNRRLYRTSQAMAKFRSNMQVRAYANRGPRTRNGPQAQCLRAVRDAVRTGQRRSARRAAATWASTCSSTRLPIGARAGSYVQAWPIQGSARWSSGVGVSLSMPRQNGSSSGP